MKDYFLEVLRRAGIEPTDCEFEDFEKRLVCGLWNKIKNERMDERLRVEFYSNVQRQRNVICIYDSSNVKPTIYAV